MRIYFVFKVSDESRIWLKSACEEERALLLFLLFHMNMNHFFYQGREDWNKVTL